MHIAAARRGFAAFARSCALVATLVVAGCGSDDVTVTTPVVLVQPADVTVTEGQRAEFVAAIGAQGGTTLQWRRNGQAIAGATAPSYVIAAATLADNGATFDLVSANAAGSATTRAARLTVNPLVPPPTITTQPTDSTVVPGVTATFTVVAAGTGLTYQWQRGGTNIAGATSASYTTPATVVGDDGATFRVVVTNPTGSVTSNAATLRVIAPPTITTQPTGASVDAGQTASFSVVAAGTGLAYQWQRGTADIAGATSASYTTPATTGADDGATFRVVVTNLAGSVTSSAATLTVTTPPTITTQPADAGVTVGTPATFTVAASGTGLSYQWQRGTTDIAGATSASYTTPATVIGDDGATFRVVVTNAAGSVTSNAATLTVTDPTPPSTFRTPPMVVGTDGSGLALKADGTVWAWGLNQHGELGQGNTTPSSSPVQVRTATGTLQRIVRLSAGPTHVLALDADGNVWAWGTTAALGIGGANGGTASSVAARVLTADGGQPLANVVDVAAGLGVSLAARADGSVAAWGINTRGQLAILGLNAFYPVTAVVPPGIVEVAAGAERSFARAADGRVFSWGDNTGSALGNPTTAPTNGSPLQVTGFSSAVRIAAGRDGAHAILPDGTLRVWGRTHWASGAPATFDPSSCTLTSYNPAATVPAVGNAASVYSTAAEIADAQVYVFGGQLFESGDRVSDDQAGTCTRALVPMAGLSGTVGASPTWGRFTHAWTSDGSVYGIGENGGGQLGLGDSTAGTGPRLLPGFNLLGNTPTGTPVLALDFESALPASVSPGSAFLTPVQGFAGLGPTGNQFGGNMLRSQTGNVVTVTLTNLPPHSSVNLSFLFAAIDSLDGAGTFPAGDYFKITLDGQTIFREAFSNATTSQVQTYLPPPGAELARRQQLGFTGGTFMDDSAYNFGADPQFQLIPHTASTLTLTFEIESVALQSLDDESWGIDNLRISLNP